MFEAFGFSPIRALQKIYSATYWPLLLLWWIGRPANSEIYFDSYHSTIARHGLTHFWLGADFYLGL
jgi:hypothetical protein